AGEVGPARLGGWWLGAGLVAVGVAGVAGVAVGPVSLRPGRVVMELVDHLPGTAVDSGLDPRQAAIVWELRLPRVVLGLLVGAMLALAGAAYQGVFRNPLADPYLLGVAAGAGLGATVAIVAGLGSAGASLGVPLLAFAGALGAVALTYALGAAGGGRFGPATLILAGVAVASFLTALQTFVQQRQSDAIRQVYSWILGRLVTAGWREVAVLLPYVVVTAVALLVYRRALDVLAVGDDEAASLGLHPQRTRLVVVVAASLGTAAAVSVSGLIGFVGIIVPHTVRLAAGTSYRVVLPLSLLFGAAFLAAADLLARVALAPAEIPIGVVTAFFGAPFFVAVLRTSRGEAAP
ncbi:MAG: FecCD family ABC transporter permease, partial [Acidimicrobiales bacterium]